MAGLTMTVRMDGVEDVIRKLRKVADAGSAKATLDDALEKGAEPIRARASELAPVGTDPVQRKRLREGIVVRDSKERGGGVWKQVAPLREVAHANLQELGTVHHAAQPFLRPAHDQKKHEAVEIVRRDLQAAIERATR